MPVSNEIIKLENYKLINRSKFCFQLVFHVMYTNDRENISTNQILSQLEILNEIYDQSNTGDDLRIPSMFRLLKSNPDMHFNLATKTVQGNPSIGITRTKISNINLACKKEFGLRNIMHATLGGLDPWDPSRYINIYVINRDQCNVLGEAIYPWNATASEDGIIIDYRAIGFSGEAVYNKPFHLGKTLVHEIGHYFGLKHLSNDEKNCQSDDLVNDTPVQSKEYFDCPQYPQTDCNQVSMTMNYMSLVNDGCMFLFTKDQVSRMYQIIQQYRSGLSGNYCELKRDSSANFNLIYENNSWRIQSSDHAVWNAELEIFDVQGKLIWKERSGEHVTFSFPQSQMNLNCGVYFLRVRQSDKYSIFKFINFN
jgi:hypothetical protein